MSLFELEPPIVSAKASKIPAPLSFSSVLRPPRIRVPKAVVYSPAAGCSPLSQGPPGSFQFSCCLFSPFAGCYLLGFRAVLRKESDSLAFRFEEFLLGLRSLDFSRICFQINVLIILSYTF